MTLGSVAISATYVVSALDWRFGWSRVPTWAVLVADAIVLLGFFGISIASFQVGGGLLLLISSLSMLNAQPAEAKASAEEVRATEVKAAMARQQNLIDPTTPDVAARYFRSEEARYAALVKKIGLTVD